VGGLVFAWKTAPPREPVYEGKTLRRWLESHVLTSSANPPYGSPGWKKADEALRHIGTNAIPILLQMIRAKDPPPVMLKLLHMLRRQRLVKIRYRYAYQRNEEAEYAFEVLGKSAAGAVPGLIRIYEEAVTPSSQRCAALALGHIGPAAEAAIPVLLKNFTHTNVEVRFNAVSAVYYIGGAPSVVVPAMKSALRDPKLEVRWNAIVALSRFGRNARSAVPELLQAFDDPAKLGDETIKEQVEIALWNIAPETIAKPLVVEERTPMVANGVTTEALDLLFNGERNTLIPSGTPVPCVAACWSSEPRGLLRLYRGTNQAAAKDHFLGQFEVVGLPPPPAGVNAQVLCVIANQQICLCARDYNRKVFLEVRRAEDKPHQ
jgi:hypothetical protein